jgi:hypothetical protein
MGNNKETHGLGSIVFNQWRSPMTSITFDSATIASTKSLVVTVTKPSILTRISQAIMTSRQRKADIEIRRMRAVVEDGKMRLDYALLPFAGE